MRENYTRENFQFLRRAGAQKIVRAKISTNKVYVFTANEGAKWNNTKFKINSTDYKYGIETRESKLLLKQAQGS